jgi:hypothetical protein
MVFGSSTYEAVLVVALLELPVEELDDADDFGAHPAKRPAAEMAAVPTTAPFMKSRRESSDMTPPHVSAAFDAAEIERRLRCDSLLTIAIDKLYQ